MEYGCTQAPPHFCYKRNTELNSFKINNKIISCIFIVCFLIDINGLFVN